jgi:hypothetical protein
MGVFHTWAFLTRRLLNRQATAVPVFDAEGREIGQVQPASPHEGTPRWRQRLTGDENWGIQLALSKDEAIKLVRWRAKGQAESNLMESAEYDAFFRPLVQEYMDETRAKLADPDLDPREFWRWHGRRGYDIARQSAAWMIERTEGR